MAGGRCGRAALAAAWLGAAVYCATVAQGQTSAPVAFDIPAQPMAAAINAWAIQANAQVFVDPGPVAHLTAPAVKGTLTPRQALRSLLARSNLQVTQGSNGVFVIKPRPAMAAAPPTPAPAPETALATAPAAPALPLQTARSSEGPWSVGISAAEVRDSGSATGGAAAVLAGEYFVSDHVAAAIAMTLPRSHSFTVPGSEDAAPNRASARLQSSALSLKYYFAPEGRLRPYLGAGLDITAFYGASGALGLSRATVGPSAAAGLDWRLSPHWMLNANLSWAQVRPDAASSPGRDIRLDPVQFGVGFVYRFGFL